MNDMTPRLRLGDEPGRQCALDRLAVLDTAPEAEFDNITRLVQSVFDVPVAAVSLIDRHRQWFKSIQGLDATETSREVAFCDYTIRNMDCLRIADATKDVRFAQNALVTGAPYIRAYLGAPVITPDGYGIGALCAIDFKPREFAPEKERILASFADLVMNELELRQVAASDGLTGLANRISFEQALGRQFSDLSESALLYLDLDRFKAINDTWGHPVGDEVIRAAAGVLIDRCPPEALAARIGGEEFAVALPRSDRATALAFAEDLRAGLANIRIGGYPLIHVSASFGVAMRSGASSTETWMAAADSALYVAKNEGRNCVRSASTH